MVKYIDWIKSSYATRRKEVNIEQEDLLSYILKTRLESKAWFFVE